LGDERHPGQPERPGHRPTDLPGTAPVLLSQHADAVEAQETVVNAGTD
jgi:hypothetical protein